VEGAFDAFSGPRCGPSPEPALFKWFMAGAYTDQYRPSRDQSREWALTWLDPDATATGEMILPSRDCHADSIDRDMALCLYTAIFTDTGSFRYSNTTPESMRIARRR